MATHCRIEPWRLAFVAGAAALTYAVGPRTVSDGGSWTAFVGVIFTIDQLVGQRTGKPVFPGVSWCIGVVCLFAVELGVLWRGVDPRVMALFAGAVALLQLLVFSRAALSLHLFVDSALKRAAASCCAAISVVAPPAAILATGIPRFAFGLAWTMSGVVPALLLLRALDRPAPRAVSIETP